MAVKAINQSRVFGLVLLAALTFAGAAAAEPVAVVEDIDAEGSSLEFMDYVEAGEAVDLGSQGRLVLSYFASCVEETITGGKVTVGEIGSTVKGGEVESRKVDCDSGQVELTERQLNASGVVAFRGGRSGASQTKPQVTLYGLSPVVSTDSPGRLTITRVDAPAPPIKLQLKPGGTDLSKRNVVLAAGAVYRAELTVAQRVRTLVFQMDAFAQAGAAPVVSRLLRF